jgi:hypothetical protein
MLWHDPDIVFLKERKYQGHDKANINKQRKKISGSCKSIHKLTEKEKIRAMPKHT